MPNSAGTRGVDRSRVRRVANPEVDADTGAGDIDHACVFDYWLAIEAGNADRVRGGDGDCAAVDDGIVDAVVISPGNDADGQAASGVREAADYDGAGIDDGVAAATKNADTEVASDRNDT